MLFFVALFCLNPGSFALITAFKAEEALLQGDDAVTGVAQVPPEATGSTKMVHFSVDAAEGAARAEGAAPASSMDAHESQRAHSFVAVSTAKSTDDPVCADEDDRCLSWARQGDCDGNPTFMRRHCKLSCKTCSVDDEAKESGLRAPQSYNVKGGAVAPEISRKAYTFQGSETSPSLAEDSESEASDADAAADSECADEDIGCLAWAVEGECVANPKYMLSHCKLSCGACNDLQDNLQFAGKGAAAVRGSQPSQTQPQAMAQQNAAAEMQSQGELKTLVDDDCRDLHQACKQWSAKGECDVNPTFMHHKCRNSCKMCGRSSSSSKARSRHE